MKWLLWGFIALGLLLLVWLHVFLLTQYEHYLLEGKQEKATVFLYSFWASVLAIPLFVLNACLSNIWGLWRARRLARRFQGKLVYSTPIPPYASVLLGVLLPLSMPRTTVGLTVVADSDALEVWWGLRSRCCARVPWGEIDSISRGETAPKVPCGKTAYWIQMCSEAWPAPFQTAILATPWSMGLYARKAEVDRIIAELIRLKAGTLLTTGLDTPSDPVQREGTCGEQEDLQISRREGASAWGGTRKTQVEYSRHLGAGVPSAGIALGDSRAARAPFRECMVLPRARCIGGRILSARNCYTGSLTVAAATIHRWDGHLCGVSGA